jgi:hypothetical protein
LLSSAISDRFDGIAINADGYRSLDHVDRNNQALVRVLGHKNPFQPIHTSTPDSYAASGSEKRVGTAGNVVGQQGPYVLDFFVRYGEADTTDADESDYAGCLQDMAVLLCVCFQGDKRVAIKEHSMDCLLPITPSMRLPDERKKRRDAYALELRCD